MDSIAFVSVPSAVDLGLSVMWANMDLNAGKDTESGAFYSWGEITPKAEYTEENYKFGKAGSMTKYNESDSEIGVSRILDPEDDAATQVLGGNGACLLSKNGRSLSQNVNGLGKRAFGLLPVRAANQYVLWQVITTRTMTLTDGKPQVFSGHPHLTKSQVRFNMPESFILAAQHAKTVYPRGITDITYDPYTRTNLKTSPQILAVDCMRNATRRKPRHNRQKKRQHSNDVGNLARKKASDFSGRPCGITRKDKIRHDEHSP